MHWIEFSPSWFQVSFTMMPRNTSQVKIENQPHLQLQVGKGRLVWPLDGQNVFIDKVTKSLCGIEEDLKWISSLMLLLSKSTSPKNNRRGGGRENKLKSSWEIKTKLCKSWEIKRNYANWRKLFVWLQLRSRHPFADVAERSGDNFQLFLKKMFLCFARKWNCQSEKFLVSSERFDNSWTPTLSKSIWSIVFFSMGWICCEVKIYSIFMLFVLYWP